MHKLQFLILIIFQLSFSQENKLKLDTSTIKLAPENLTWIGKTCENGKEYATVDFKNSTYNYYTYGFTISTEENDKFHSFLKKYLKDKCSINYEHKGCVMSDESECYSKTMIKLIEEKFGSGFLDKKIEEARKVYSKK